MKQKTMVPKLPKQFEIFGQTFKIRYSDDLYSLHGAYGLSNFNENVILIQRPNATVQLSEDHVMATLWHEIFHFILNALSYHDANKDEDFVDRVGQALAQIQKTIK